MIERTNTATRWAAITASDTAWLEPTPVSVYIGAAGNIVVEGDDGVTATFAVSAGQELPVQARRVLSTGTTATGLIGFYNS